MPTATAKPRTRKPASAPAPVAPAPNTLRLLAALHELYAATRERWYAGELPDVAITVIPAGRRNALGWCSRDERWTNEANGASLRELNLAAEHLNRTPEEIAATVLHEAVHVWTQANGIMDTSRSGKYHNAKFRDAATAHGLTCEQMEGHGWAFTGLTDEARAWLDALTYDREALTLARATEARATKRQGSPFIIYTCEACGYKVRATSADSQEGDYADGLAHCGEAMRRQA
jgi:hypothetical protein